MGFKLFADDTQFYMALDNIDNIEGKIKLIMDDVGKWMESKQLKLSQDKTECLIVGKKQGHQKDKYTYPMYRRYQFRNA